MKTILFVQGYNTYGYNTYGNVVDFFDKNECYVFYFMYDSNDDIKTIQNRFTNFMNDNISSYDYIIGHSAGCYFLIEYLRIVNKKIDNIIFICPYIYISDNDLKLYIEYIPDSICKILKLPNVIIPFLLTSLSRP